MVGSQDIIEYCDLLKGRFTDKRSLIGHFQQFSVLCHNPHFLHCFPFTEVIYQGTILKMEKNSVTIFNLSLFKEQVIIDMCLYCMNRTRSWTLTKREDLLIGNWKKKYIYLFTQKGGNSVRNVFVSLGSTGLLLKERICPQKANSCRVDLISRQDRCLEKKTGRQNSVFL